MTLEAVIAENTNALRELIETIKNGVPTTSAQVAAVAQAPVVQEKKEPKKQASAPAAEMPASTTTGAASSKEAPDYKTTSAAVLRLVETKGNEVTRKLLASFDGATNLKQIDPSKFAEVLEKINEALGA